MADWPYNTARWRKLREAKLGAEPLCEPCRYREFVRSANTVDHIKAIADGGDPFPPLEGLMSMCTRCHNEKTAAVDRSHSKPFARRMKGVDASGNPVDRGDGWHNGGASNHEDGGARGPMGKMQKYLVSDSCPNRDDLTPGIL